MDGIVPGPVARLALDAEIAHIVPAVLEPQDLFVVLDAHRLEGVLRQGQDLFGPLALQLRLADDTLELFVFPLQLAVGRKDRNAHVQVAHGKMVGPVDVADDVIQVPRHGETLVDQGPPREPKDGNGDQEGHRQEKGFFEAEGGEQQENDGHVQGDIFPVGK